MIKGIIFDFDGTLIDTMDDFRILAGKLLHQYYPQISVEEGEKLYIETSGIAFEKQIEIIMPNGKLNNEVVYEFETKKLDSRLDDGFHEEIRNVLMELNKKNYILAISSGNYPHVIEKILEKESIKFELIMGHKKNFEKGKAHFDYFIKKTGLKKDEILFIGDSIKDGQRSKASDIPFIAIEGIFKKERFIEEFGKDQIVISHLFEIFNYL